MPIRDWIARVAFRGLIGERAIDPYLRLLRGLRDRRRVRGVLLEIASGGGAAVPSYDFYLAVKRLSQAKPVIASIGSVGASGGYMAALGARKIYSYPESIVGSIGVVYPHLAVRGLLSKLGIDVELLHEGRHKDAYQGLRPLSDEERAKLQAVTHDDYVGFVDLVARERRMSLGALEPLATGEFWSGRQALKLGLIDALGDREAALEELAGMTGLPSRRAFRVAPPRPFLDRVLSGGATLVGESLASGLRQAFEEAFWESLFNRPR